MAPPPLTPGRPPSDNAARAAEHGPQAGTSASATPGGRRTIPERFGGRALGGASDAETLLAGVLRLADVAVVAVTGYVAFYLRTGEAEPSQYYLVAFVLGTLLTANFMHLARVYRLHDLRRPTLQFGRSAAAWIAVLTVLVVLSYLTKTSVHYSRIWFFLWFVTALGGFTLVRMAVLAQLQRWREAGRVAKRMAVVGSGEPARTVARQIVRTSGSDMRLLGFFSESADAAKSVPEGPVLSDLEHLADEVRRHGIEMLVVAVPWDETERLENVMAAVRRLPIDVCLCPEPLPLDIPVRGFSEVAGMPVLDVWQRPLSAWAQVIKAVEDRLLASLLLLVFSPLMLLVAGLIKLDNPGPALFRQTRAGFNENRFQMLKFRTMRQDAEAAGAETVAQARRDDPRVTRVGRWLRRTSLDELPQLINVVKGEMSLVGPRPHAVAHDDYYAGVINEYLGRLRVKPGMTGWAQVNGLRGETDTAEKMRMRVRYDLYYIDNWSVPFDLKILFLTLFVGFVNQNAY